MRGAPGPATRRLRASRASSQLAATASTAAAPRAQPVAGARSARPRSRRRSSRAGSAPERARELDRLGERRTRGSRRARRPASGSAQRRRGGGPCPGGAPELTASTTITSSAPAQRVDQADRLALVHRRTRGPARAARAATARPAASSPRHALPTPMTSALSRARPRASGSGSRTRCRGRSCGSPARSAWRSSSSSRSRLPARRSRAGRPRSRAWFCEVGGTILASRIVPSSSSRVAVPEHARAAPRSSRSRSPARGATSTAGAVGRLVGVDQPQRLVERVEDLDRADDDAAERVAADRRRGPASAAASRASGESRVEVERVAGERPDEVGAALAQARVQRGRVLDVLLDEVLLVLAGRDVEPAARDEPAALDRVLVRRRAARRTRSPRSKSGKSSAGGPAHRLERELARPLERLDERRAARARAGAR